MRTKITAFLLVILTLAACLVSCSDTNDITYTEEGMTFTLPKNMRRTSSSVYEICFTTLATGFNAMRLDKEKLAELGLPEGMTADEYKDFFIEENEIDGEQIELEYDEELKAYVFHYSLSTDEEAYTFFYTMVFEGNDAPYFVSMTCDNELANDYVPTFKIWARSISFD